MTEVRLGFKVKSLKKRIVRLNQEVMMATFDPDWPKQPTSMEAKRKGLNAIVADFESTYSCMNTKDSVFMQDEIYKALDKIGPDSYLQRKHNFKYSPEHQN